MTLEINKTAIELELKVKGYCLLNSISAADGEFLISQLGHIMHETQIKENSQSSLRINSNRCIDFHSDHYSAHFVAWYCHRKANSGGEKLLIDIAKILNSFSPFVLQILNEINIKAKKVFSNDPSVVPLLTKASNGQYQKIYYDPDLVDDFNFKFQNKALLKFKDEINTANKIKFLLSEGDLLIIDNQRMLHARNAFDTGSGRWLTRYWVRQVKI